MPHVGELSMVFIPRFPLLLALVPVLSVLFRATSAPHGSHVATTPRLAAPKRKLKMCRNGSDTHSDLIFALAVW